MLEKTMPKPLHDAAERRHDIASRADCERLVRAFYGRALVDPVIGWLFTDVAHLDLEAHLPRIAAFWEAILLDGTGYRGGAFAPHAALHAKAPLRAGHFERWLHLWHGTVDELFAGPRAELAKRHADRVARAFHGRLTGGGAGAGADADSDVGVAPGAPPGAELPLITVLAPRVP